MRSQPECGGGAIGKGGAGDERRLHLPPDCRRIGALAFRHLYDDSFDDPATERGRRTRNWFSFQRTATLIAAASRLTP